MMPTSAFVLATPFVSARASPTTLSDTQRPLTNISTVRTRYVSMAASKPTDRKAPTVKPAPGKSAPVIEEDIVEPQGFTLYNERVNGQLAMLGFVIGVTTEVLSKDHVTILGQIGMILAPVTSMFAVVTRELQALL